MGGVLHETANQKKQNKVKMRTKKKYEKTKHNSNNGKKKRKKKGMLSLLCLDA